ncbi:MAG: hypothetical protein J0M08_14160 [Bacteroidetes bacterium]|nr:hypothetical protein [Bacteroidota bacterium]
MAFKLTLKKQSLMTLLFIVIFIIVADVLKITMFSGDMDDGFFSQVIYVSDNFANGSAYSPLFLIHVLRLLIVAPFFISYLLGLPPFFDALFFILYLIPLLACQNKVFRNLGLIAIFLPLAFSYRTVLGMLSIIYLYYCLFYQTKRYYLIGFSALLANLSSGIVLGWLLAVISSIFYIKSFYPKFFVVISFMMFGFLGSLLHKIEYMISEQGASQNGSVIERSTIYVSFYNGQNFRFSLYVFLIFILFFIVVAPLYSKNFRARNAFFFASSIPLIFFEGVGLISYFLCFLLVIFKSYSKRDQSE